MWMMGNTYQRVLQYIYPMQNKGVLKFNRFMTSIVTFKPVLKFWLSMSAPEGEAQELFFFVFSA